MPAPVPHPPTIESADALDTEVVNLLDLNLGDYVLAPEDFDDPEIPLLVDHDYPVPLLLRVGDFEDGDEGPVIVFDTPDDVYARIELTGQGEDLRRVLPGQDHPEWEMPAYSSIKFG